MIWIDIFFHLLVQFVDLLFVNLILFEQTLQIISSESADQFCWERFGKNCNSGCIVLAGGLAINLWEEIEMLDQVGEEQKQFRL